MDWDDYFCSMLPLVASKSKDNSVKIGAIIVGPDHEIRSTGYNGFPRGIIDKPARFERPEKYVWTEHAERNAIYNAARIGVSLKDCTLYLNWWPCPDCARGIIQVGIKEVIIHTKSVKPSDKSSLNDESITQRVIKMLFEGCVFIGERKIL